jgi:hypothetical protein
MPLGENEWAALLPLPNRRRNGSVKNPVKFTVKRGRDEESKTGSFWSTKLGGS